MSGRNHALGGGGNITDDGVQVTSYRSPGTSSTKILGRVEYFFRSGEDMAAVHEIGITIATAATAASVRCCRASITTTA